MLPRSAQSREIVAPVLVGVAAAWLLTGCPEVEKPVQVIISQPEKARHARTQSDFTAMHEAVSRMRNDTGNRNPSCFEKLENLLQGPCPAECGALPRCGGATEPGARCWSGPYLEAIGPDPWGNPYRVSVDPASLLVTVTGAGPDGVFGTADDEHQMM
jgi:hypothetical protein